MYSVFCTPWYGLFIEMPLASEPSCRPLAGRTVEESKCGCHPVSAPAYQLARTQCGRVGRPASNIFIMTFRSLLLISKSIIIHETHFLTSRTRRIQMISESNNQVLNWIVIPMNARIHKATRCNLIIWNVTANPSARDGKWPTFTL